tara:strand:- start:2815 stop:3747 length:933 start_codon:yes stop_codon:yes gene_type:complete
MKKVFITRRLPAIAEERLKEKFDVYGSRENEPYPRKLLPEIVGQYDAVLSTVTEKFNKEILKQKGKLTVISNYAVGLDNIDVEFAKSLGIAIYNTKDVVTNSTADLTFSIFLSLIRKILLAQVFIRNDNWKTWDPELFLGEELNGKVFGILGFGKIGQAVARRAFGFDLNIIFTNRSDIDAKYCNDIKARCVSFDELLAISDYISIHLPLTDLTRGIINRKIINKMKRKPIIINMSRGEIVVTNDLLDALKKGKIRGACLDVTAPEPIHADHPLCQLENCIIVPHIGTATLECRNNMALLAAENIINHFY